MYFHQVELSALVFSGKLVGNEKPYLNYLNLVCCSYLSGSPFFRDDTRLRALRFLDHMLVRA